MISKRRLKAVIALAGLAGIITAGLQTASSLAQTGTTETQVRLRQQGEAFALQQGEWYHYKGVITGRVRLSDGKPAAGFTVRAQSYRQNFGPESGGYTVTDADGVYRIHGLSPQDHSVRVESGAAPYLEAPPRRVSLANAGEVAANVDFLLPLGPQVTILVRDAQSGKPIPGMVVKANSTSRSLPETIGSTDAGGLFRFRTNQLETEIQLRPKDDDSSFQEAPGSHFFKVIRFPSADAARDTVWDVNAYSYRAGPRANETVFRGTVTGPEDKPVGGASILMVREGNSWATVTDAEGSFSFQTARMQPGEYGAERRGILIEAKKDDLIVSHYATPEETWTTIPIRLAREVRASVTGRVVGVDGKPIGGVLIHYYESFPAVKTFTQKNAPATDADGRFVITGLSQEALYSFRFGKPAAEGNDFGFGLSEFPETSGPENNYGRIQLKKGERRDLGRIVVLRSDAALAGRLVTRTGATPTGSLMVVIEGEHTRASVMMDPDGRFRFPRVVREPLTLGVFAPDADDPRFFRTDLTKPGAALARKVNGGDENLMVTLL